MKYIIILYLLKELSLYNEVVLSDVDGVIVSFSIPFIKYINKKYRKCYTINNLYNYNFRISLGLSNEQYTRSYYEFLETDAIKKLRFYKGVRPLFKYLEKKYRTILVTALESYARPARIINLKKINYTDLLFDVNRIEVIKNLKPKYVFEDRPEFVYNYLSNEEYFKYLFIPIQPYNFQYMSKWIHHPKVFMFDDYRVLLKSIKLLEET